MMRKTSAIVIAVLLIGTVAAWAQDGQGSQGDQGQGAPADPAAKAAAYVGSVYGDLAAWRHTQARESMEEHKAEFGKAAGYDTAWAFMLAQERKFDQAVPKLKKAARNEKSDPAPAYYLGEVLAWKENSEGANKAWEDARNRAKAITEADPTNGWAWYWEAAAEIRLGNPEPATAMLEKALSHGADKAMGEFQLGLARTYLKEWTLAKDAYTRCITADAGFAHAYYYRGRVWKQLGKTEEMLLDLDRFVKLAPDAREFNAAMSILRAGG